jgi:putative transcriptional regulator
MANTNNSLYLTNQFLIAMPLLTDPYFAHAVTYICEHNENGAIGIVINQPLELQLAEVFKQMEIEVSDTTIGGLPVLCGGPIHPERGFVLHTPSGTWRSSLEMSSEICVTTSRDILQAIAQNQGPQEMLISLGYASWTAGQLEQEIINNFWLTAPVSTDILFKLPFNERWEAAIRSIGIDLNKLSEIAGHS